RAFDVNFGTTWEITQQDVLHGRQAKFRLEALNQAPEGGAKPKAPFILDPAILDADAVVPLAVSLWMPTEMGLDPADRYRPGLLQRSPNVAGEHFTKLFDTPVVHQVLDPRA